ncbi:MAG: cyclic nucleotide-binding domain-containing protein [Candidatus Thiodiazotropha sp.]|nr:cyclic nucleotide-binding domain-containing protein [Candidatus Thiodiazotropha taylori]MBT3059118.1 cyclic nucleotide-binding domain-containing protein [Candidatus Thiodiazotropha sp. (ex Lucina pensylvanica)]MBV2093997.1 cyclic nucleotide-binding domain-containing protein [Candidatus Thiodiazotropha sp. (ex Codakia orbicularis)]PUB75496.1 MAG: cyclic nucleotide-binding protein [gamma proteobacterium symbiont of Ctena orbiculata]MBT3063695.1 cyclic nucleotide-binding domain-containing prote
MLESRLRMLQGMPIFGAVNEATLELILNKAEIVEVAKDGFFFREGDLDNSIYILERGRVAAYRHWQGKRYKLRELSEGDCFGEMALMDFKPRSAEVAALDESCAIRVTAAQLGELYKTDSEQYTLIYMNLGREVCRRLRDADSRLFVHEINEQTER